MHSPDPAGRKPSPRPRSIADDDPPDDTAGAAPDARSTEDSTSGPAVPTTVAVTTRADTAAGSDAAPSDPAEATPTEADAPDPDAPDPDGSEGDVSEGDGSEVDTAADDGAEPRGRAATLAARLRPRRILAAVLVLAVLGGLGVAASAFFAQRAEQQARTEALAAAERYAVDLSSYDHEDLDGNFRTVQSNATGQFGQQYRQVSENLTTLLKQHKATSEGNVVRAGIAEAGADRAVVLLFVDQTISNTNTDQPRVDRNRMEMTLVRHEDRWLVDKVTLL
ncbi:Mce-associated membrane protein [Prauserella sediminis]|uniref:Mce-associated membrane protein n=1 Tax=Prauserella sediminis TaxID=577680 RepID=A0A839XWJ2_9PSEU|nr:hypothetical protein [Prauserella sediminis]MBB3664853.1 Mce-associated membrane protein [Prauserella sediminis]